MNVRTAMAITAGTKYPGHGVGEFLDRRAAALRLSDHVDDLREERFRSNLLCAHDKRAGLVDCGADHTLTAPFSTGIGSPVIIDSSMLLRPSMITPSIGIFSPGRTRSISPFSI